MAEETRKKPIDPVCGMEVETSSPYKSYRDNGYYYFCSAEDKELFDKEPEKYIKEDTVPAGSCD